MIARGSHGFDPFQALQDKVQGANELCDSLKVQLADERSLAQSLKACLESEKAASAVFAAGMLESRVRASSCTCMRLNPMYALAQLNNAQVRHSLPTC